MNCKKCGSPLTENDQFCKSCGAAANEISAQKNNPGDLSTQQPMNNGIGGQPINQQQSWTNSYNTTPVYNQTPQKNSGNGKFIIIGIIIAVAILAGIIVVGMFSGDDSSSNNELSNSGSSNSSSQVSNSTYSVKFKGFTFSIPDNLVYEEDNGTLLIGDEMGTWVTLIEIEEGSFAQIKANKSQLQSRMQQSGYTSSIAQEKTLGGVDFITLEISASGQNGIAAFTKANSMYFMGVVAVNLDNEFDYSLLEKIAPIISSASYSGATANMEVGTKLDMSKIAEITK